jgi:hypothetical protein
MDFPYIIMGVKAVPNENIFPSPFLILTKCPSITVREVLKMCKLTVVSVLYTHHNPRKQNKLTYKKLLKLHIFTAIYFLAH